MEKTTHDLILFLIIVVIFVALGITYGPKIMELISDTSCSADISQKASFKILGKTMTELDHCEMDFLKIENKKDLENAKEEIANKMYDCWKQFGKGKIDFLEDWDFGASNTYCFPCTQIMFSEELKDKKITDFTKYLDENIIPGENITYTQFLTDSKEAKLNVPEFSSKNEIVTNQNLYILFIANKKANFIENLQKSGWIGAGELLVLVGSGALIGFVTPVPGGALAGATYGFYLGITSVAVTGTIIGTGYKNDYYSTLLLLQSDELIKACNKK